MDARSVLYCSLIWLTSVWVSGKTEFEDSKIIMNSSYDSLPNYYMIRFSAIDDEEIHCQHNNCNENWNCTWQYPNGTDILNLTDGHISTLNETDYEGLYTCTCTSCNNEESQTITAVLGIYTYSTFNNYTGPKASNISMQVYNYSSIDISFNVTNGPPTCIHCNGPISFSASTANTTRVVNDHGNSTLVTITVNGNSEGEYTCHVSNNEVSKNTEDSNTSLTIKAAEIPENVTVERLDSGLTHIGISWCGQSSKYWIFRNDSEPYTVNTTSLNITDNLKLNETYSFCVVAIGNSTDNEIPSNKSETECITLTTPTISNISTELNVSNVTVMWSDPSPIVPINGYKGIIRCDDCENSKITNYEGNSTFDQLSMIIAYSYLTENCKLFLQGHYGNDIHNLTMSSLEGPYIPLPPKNVTAIPIDAYSIAVSWEINNCSSSFDKYQLFLNENKTHPIVELANDIMDYNITRLSPYTNYSIEIRSFVFNESVSSLPSEAVTVTTLESTPGKVTNLTSIGVDVDAIMVSWNTPEIPNGIITNYHIQYNDSMMIIPKMQTVVLIQKLQKHNSTYSISVRATTSAGKGESQQTTAKTNDIETVGGINVTQINCTTYKTQWNSIESSAINNYSVIISRYNNEDNIAGAILQIFNTSNNTNSLIIDGLEEVEYSFMIRAVYIIGGNEVYTQTTPVKVSKNMNCTTNNTENSTPLILRVPYLSSISGSVSVLLLSVIIITTVIVICTRRKCKRTKYLLNTTPMQCHIQANQTNTNKTNNKGNSFTFKPNNEPDLKEVITEPVPLSEFCDYVAKNHLHSVKGFKSQYEKLLKGEDFHRSKISVTPANSNLNRFVNITVFDDNRVILEPLENEPDYQNDYINASYIQGYTSAYKYIATQGPIPRTLVDFWRLIWQEASPVIVMVTNLKEDLREKCTQYWPDTGYIDFGPFTVTLIGEQIFIDYTERKFELQMKDISLKCHQVTQYHFTSWPDHGVPQYSNSMMNFHKHIKENYNPESGGSMVVHCSAGVGRTGTFITIDIALQQIEKEGIVNIPGIINELRHQRTRMVQTIDQFIFINDAVLEYMLLGNTQINVADLRIQVHELNKVDPITGINNFQKQFELIEKMTPKPDDIARKAGLGCEDRNRSMQYLPPDKNRIYLKNETNNYIHASFIASYKKAMSFIVAENPMQSTGKLFWKMIIDFKIPVIVMLGNTKEIGMDICYHYWPIGSETIVIGEYTVNLESKVEKARYVERVFKITNDEGNFERNVVQYQITSWHPNGEIDEVNTVTDIIEEACKIQRTEGSMPIVVHCSDTVTRSGIFCASATAIEKCKAEKVIDIFQVVKAQRMQKPGSVPCLDHFRFIFEIVQTYLDSFDEYSNFKLN